MKNMFLYVNFTTVGILVTFIVAIISLVNGDQERKVKKVLVVFVLMGFVIGVVSAIKDSKDTVDAKTIADAAIKDLSVVKKNSESDKIRLEMMHGILEKVKGGVSELTILEQLSGKGQYYVRIAADRFPENLERYRINIENQFQGAKGIVEIRKPNRGSSMYKLVFGHHLNVAEAEIYHRLAMSHEFPPRNHDGTIQVAQICLEPKILE